MNKLFQSRTPRNTEPEWSEWTTIETPTSLPQSQELRDYDATVQSLGEPEAELPVDAAATRDSSLASSSPHPITNNHDQQSITAGMILLYMICGLLRSVHVVIGVGG